MLIASIIRSITPLKHRSIQVHTRLQSATSQKTVIFILIYMKTWNLTKHVMTKFNKQPAEQESSVTGHLVASLIMLYQLHELYSNDWGMTMVMVSESEGSSNSHFHWNTSIQLFCFLRYDVLTVVKKSVLVFWVVTTFSGTKVETICSFKSWCLPTSLNGVTHQETNTDILKKIIFLSSFSIDFSVLKPQYFGNGFCFCLQVMR
jgi:hypothetical protein